MRNKFNFKKICKRCGEVYQPLGKYQKYCLNCNKSKRDYGKTS